VDALRPGDGPADAPRPGRGRGTSPGRRSGSRQYSFPYVDPGSDCSYVDLGSDLDSVADLDPSHRCRADR
jgi:hypothetical protein